MDKKKITIILIAVAVALIAGAGYYLWQKRKDAPIVPDETPVTQPQAVKLLPANPVLPKYISPAVPAKVSVPATKAGASAYPKGTSANVRTDPKTTAKVLFEVKKGIKAGIATGETRQMPDGLWHKLNTAKGAGWVRNDVVTLSYV